MCLLPQDACELERCPAVTWWHKNTVHAAGDLIPLTSSPVGDFFLVCVCVRYSQLSLAHDWTAGLPNQHLIWAIKRGLTASCHQGAFANVAKSGAGEMYPCVTRSHLSLSHYQ